MARTTGILSKNIKLSYKTSGGSFTEVANLQSIPDLGAEPERVETTCLSDGNRTYINGIKDYGTLTFGFLYDATIFSTLDALGSADWEVALSDGSKFTFTGEASCALVGVGVNEALTFNLNINLSSDITFAAA